MNYNIRIILEFAIQGMTRKIGIYGQDTESTILLKHLKI